MAEKKNLVIKVRYPTASKANEDSSPNAQVITVWNVPRIGLAAGACIGLIVLLVYVFGGDGRQPVVAEVAVEKEGESAVPQVSPGAPAQIEMPVASVKNMPSPETSVGQPALSDALPSGPLAKDAPRVRRAVVTTGITDKEPVNKIAGSLVIRPSKPVTVYYFTELRYMAGKTIYHEWLHDGVSVAKEPLLIAAERWRVSTHKTLDEKAVGSWTVKLTDENANLLDEKKFVANIGQ
ncbi:DUF2914 domain-containing protein [Methylovulum miyakonense]|uniref:DUF2914 domain-containing protein n=1 Tax=Methylovulum miyakonense TaxID=645578 RepID=UPI00036B313C|nr:DUF2914 domain-containing protein [Methylovulum miyakonense]